MASKKALDFDAELAAAAEEAQPFIIGGETFTPKPVDSVPASELYDDAGNTVDALCRLLVDESAERVRTAGLSHRQILFAYRKLYALHATLPTTPPDE